MTISLRDMRACLIRHTSCLSPRLPHDRTAHWSSASSLQGTWWYLTSYLTYLGDEVHTPFALLLLKLERNASHRAPLNTLHEVGHKASDLVAHPLGRDDGNLVAHPLVRVEVHGQARVVLLDDGSRRLLHGLRADTLNAHSVERSCRQCQRTGENLTDPRDGSTSNKKGVLLGGGRVAVDVSVRKQNCNTPNPSKV